MGSLLSAIKMLYELVMGVKSLIAFVEANKTEAWFQESAKAMTQIRAAKSEQEYKDAAKALRDLWNGAG